ncbi:hypothetical protein F5883DRAFT_583369 [Diaporthe sp. PMI_573]|nr:hypothetical protein F5883DRAFT_583369 [Diaporthaceae sp. PMI_573]
MPQTTLSPQDERLVGIDVFDRTEAQNESVSEIGPFAYPVFSTPESPRPIQNPSYCGDAQEYAQFCPPCPSFVDLNQTNTSPGGHVGPGPPMTGWMSSDDLYDPNLFSTDREQLATAAAIGSNSDDINRLAPAITNPHDPTTTPMGSTLSAQPFLPTTLPGSSSNFKPAAPSWFTQQGTPSSTTRTTPSTVASPRSAENSACSRASSTQTPVSPISTQIEPTQLDYRFAPPPEELKENARGSSASVSKGKDGKGQEKRNSLAQTKPARTHKSWSKMSNQSPKPTKSQPQNHHQSLLKRNRIAATKCRAKTKAAMAELEATEKAMCTKHYQLSTAVMGLREEVLMLKSELLKHGNCDCKVIQQYLTNAAKSVGTGMNAQRGVGVSSAPSQPEELRQ